MFVPITTPERQALEAKQTTLRESCRSFLSGHERAANSLQETADFARALGLEADRYGSGTFLQSFEKEIAELLRKEAAVFMPSGTMAPFSSPAHIAVPLTATNRAITARVSESTSKALAQP